MMWWMNAAQYATEALAIVLIFRLLSLRERRERVYSVFVAFLVIQLVETVTYFAYTQWWREKVDYRYIWISSTIILAAFSLWLVYSLARAVLTELPGILRFSRILLNAVFPVAIILAFSTARSEWASRSAKFQDPLDRLMFVVSIADRGISMAALLVLLAILAFILWFPVKMPKNLAIFSVGFVLYFTAKTGFELFRNYLPAVARNALALSVFVSVVLIACFLYWIVFLDPKGQTAQVRLGHGWRLAEQNKLIEQLDALNGVLMRSSQRMEL